MSPQRMDNNFHGFIHPLPDALRPGMGRRWMGDARPQTTDIGVIEHVRVPRPLPCRPVLSLGAYDDRPPGWTEADERGLLEDLERWGETPFDLEER